MALYVFLGLYQCPIVRATPACTAENEHLPCRSHGVGPGGVDQSDDEIEEKLGKKCNLLVVTIVS